MEYREIHFKPYRIIYQVIQSSITIHCKERIDIVKQTRIAIIGAGHIGVAIASGLVESGRFQPEEIVLTRRRMHLLDGMKEKGFAVESSNREAVKKCDVVIIAVEPQQMDGVLAEIAPELSPGRHTVVSVVTGVNSTHIIRQTGGKTAVVRAMPNTAIAVRESMTCLAADGADKKGIETAQSIFDAVGKTVVVSEEEMMAATALGACGIAFFLRAIRAASQGGIEVGFHSEEALAVAAQTARGAATLLLRAKNHPEYEIDRVTTPKGCTISGLNQMEHDGFSSAMIKGIVVSASRAAELYKGSKS
jgi:pyrroline-5-carboxylate reductase